MNVLRFKACHSHVPPENFFLACQYDSSNNPAGVCASLQSYASVCSLFGVCIYWRNYTSQCSKFMNKINRCNLHYIKISKSISSKYSERSISSSDIECSEDKVFLPCGSFEPPTCRDRYGLFSLIIEMVVENIYAFINI